jgi:hypothetical protein
VAHNGAMAHDERLFGVLVTFGRPVELATHLEVLDGQSRQVDFLLVVDNANDPASEAIVRDRFVKPDRAELISMGSNTGPAGGIAAGLRRVLELGDDTDWVVLLDDDDPPRHPTDLEELLDLAVVQRRSDPSVALVGTTGARFDPSRGRLQRLADEELCGILDVDYVAGGLLPIISVGALRAVGVFRDDFFFGFDDLEFGLRLRAAGMRILIDGSLAHRARSEAGRLGGGFSGPSLASTAAPWRRYYSVRNLIVLLRERGSSRGAIRVSLSAGLAKPFVLFVRSPSNGRRDLAMGVRGVLDGWLGRMGQRVAPKSR